MIKEFKFFNKEQTQKLKPFNLNVLNDIFGRIPSYTIAFEPYDNNGLEDAYGNVGQLIDGRLEIAWCFVELTIVRHNTAIQITHSNVDGLNARGLIFAREDRVIVRYKRD